MMRTMTAPAALLLGLGLLAGCANDGTFGGGTSNLTTNAVSPAPAPKVDPACVTLSAQIETLRKEGTIERLQQASQGKSDSVQVKRAAIAKQTELNKANADFQAKCSTITPKPASVTAPTPAPAAKEAAAAAGAGAATAAAAPAQTAAVAAPAAQAAKKVVKKAAAPVAAVKAAAPVAAVKAAAPVAAAAPVVVPTAAPAVVPTAIAPTQNRAPEVVVTTIPAPKE